jgi:hypothetical protein
MDRLLDRVKPGRRCLAGRWSYVADTYNDKVEWLDPATHATTSWLGGARNSGIRAAFR